MRLSRTGPLELQEASEAKSRNCTCRHHKYSSLKCGGCGRFDLKGYDVTARRAMLSRTPLIGELMLVVVKVVQRRTTCLIHFLATGQAFYVIEAQSVSTVPKEAARSAFRYKSELRCLLWYSSGAIAHVTSAYQVSSQPSSQYRCTLHSHCSTLRLLSPCLSLVASSTELGRSHYRIHTGTYLAAWRPSCRCEHWLP